MESTLEDSRKRRNFSLLERERLMSCVQKHKHVIENKVTNAVTNRQKKSAWKAIQVEFNSRPGAYKRTTDQLINLYKNSKRAQKKNKVVVKMEIVESDGDVPAKSNRTEESIQERLLPADAITTPLPNVRDSDSHNRESTENENVDSGEEFIEEENCISEDDELRRTSKTANETSKTVPTTRKEFERPLHRKRKDPLPSSSTVAAALLEQAELKTSAIRQEMEFRRKEHLFKEEEHKIKIQILNAQLTLVKKVSASVSLHPERINLNVVNSGETIVPVVTEL